MITRELDVIAQVDGSVEKNLKLFGFSTRLCTVLKQKLGLVKVNGIPAILPAKICQNDVIHVIIEEKTSEIIPFDARVDIAYEDDDLAIINKAPNIAVIPTNQYFGTSLMNALANIWGEYVYHPVNRLDRGTSGLMVVAKNSLAHSILSVSLCDEDRTKNIEREYLALVQGAIHEDIVIDEPIGQPYSDTMIRGVDYLNGKEARTYCRPLEIIGEYTLARLKLDTGRTHQIRVHMSHIGHPLVGDDLYGGDNRLISRPCLHSYRIKFTHPITKEIIELEIPLPSDIQQVIAEIRNKQ